MANIIAVIWDCDKTLIDGYMQDPILQNIKLTRLILEKVNAKPMELAEKGIRVNRDTYYLNYFIECAHNGTFKGLNNQNSMAMGRNRNFIEVSQKSSRKLRICSRTIKVMQNTEFKLNIILLALALLKLSAVQI